MPHGDGSKHLRFEFYLAGTNLYLQIGKKLIRQSSIFQVLPLKMQLQKSLSLIIGKKKKKTLREP